VAISANVRASLRPLLARLDYLLFEAPRVPKPAAFHPPWMASAG
jgi:hypothetical protein